MKTNKVWIFLLFVLSNLMIQSSHAFDHQTFNDVDRRHSIPLGLYAGLKGGLSGGYNVDCDTATNLGYYGTVFAGYKWAVPYPFVPPLRFEGEITYRSANMHSRRNVGTLQLKHVKGDVRLWSYLCNVILDMNCDFPMRPYIGAGLGFAHANGKYKAVWTEQAGNFFSLEKHISEKINKCGFAWQGILGLRFYFCDTFEAAIEYRFLKIENKLANHNIGINISQFF